MSGPVRPPLTVEESDGSVVVRPANTIKFNAADFTVAKSGDEATISIDSTGTGAALTQSYIGFGDSSNLLTGSANFTFVDETGGSGPTVTLTGDKPILIMQDDTSATDFFSEFTQSGASLELRSKNSAGANVEIFRTRADSITFNDDGVDMDFVVKSDTRSNALRVAGDTGFIGINEEVPETPLEITDDGTNQTLLQLQSTDTDGDVGPTMNFWRNSASPANGDNLGQIQFLGEDSGGSRQQFGNFYMDADVVTAGAESGSFRFNVFQAGSSREALRIRGSEVVVNDASADIDFRVESDSQTHAFQVDAGRSAIGIGAIATDSDKVNVVADNAFDPTTSTDADMYNTINIDSSAAPTGHGNFGGALTFSGVGSSRRRAGIANVQTTSDATGDEVGLAFFTHDPASPSNNETLNEHMRLDDNGRLIISDTDIGTDTTSARLFVRRATVADVPTVLIQNTAAPDTSSYATQLTFEALGTPSDNASLLGKIDFKGDDSGAGTHTYASMQVIMADKGAGTEDGIIKFFAVDGGSDTSEHFTIGNGAVRVNDGGQNDIDFRVESDNNVYMFMVDASQDNIGVGANPSGSGGQFQIDGDCSYLRDVNTTQHTSNHDVTDLEAHGGVLIMKTSSGTGNFNLPAGVAGMHLRLINMGAEMNVVTNAGDSLNGVLNSGTTATLATAITGTGSALELTCIANGVWIANNMAAPAAT